MALWVRTICYESLNNLNSDLQETHGTRVWMIPDLTQQGAGKGDKGISEASQLTWCAQHWREPVTSKVKMQRLTSKSCPLISKHVPWYGYTHIDIHKLSLNSYVLTRWTQIYTQRKNNLVCNWLMAIEKWEKQSLLSAEDSSMSSWFWRWDHHLPRIQMDLSPVFSLTNQQELKKVMSYFS